MSNHKLPFVQFYIATSTGEFCNWNVNLWWKSRDINSLLLFCWMKIQLRRIGGCQLLLKKCVSRCWETEKSFVHLKRCSSFYSDRTNREMLCLVRQADSVIIEVEVDAKAKGKQCLDKVSYIVYVFVYSDALWKTMYK